MALTELTRGAVEAAIAEYDALGETRFLEKYGFGQARQYHLIVDGRLYPSKAIAVAAHGYLSANSPPLRAGEFSGGEQTVAQTLRGLGFKVSGGTRNPDWIRDELVLALDLYMQNPQTSPGKASAEILALSQQINQLNVMLGRTGDDSFRNPNGVYMKVMNFRRFDPSFTSQGKTGLTHGGVEDENVWNEFASDPTRLTAVASAIRSALTRDASPFPDSDVDEIEEAEEGRLLTAIHRRRERSRNLVAARKAKAVRETGELRCEACNLSFVQRYGELGEGFMEVHHLRPLHTLREGDRTALSDLALLCSNCHRMIHRRRKWLSIAELRSMVR